MKTIKNVVPEEVIKSIPATRNDRISFVKRRLRKYQDCRIYSNALQTLVEIKPFSIEETAEHASHSKKSIIAALNISQIIKNAEFVRFLIPKSDSKRQKKRFIFLIELHAVVADVGEVKLLVGVIQSKGYLHYSLTVPE